MDLEGGSRNCEFGFCRYTTEHYAGRAWEPESCSELTTRSQGGATLACEVSLKTCYLALPGIPRISAFGTRLKLRPKKGEA